MENSRRAVSLIDFLKWAEAINIESAALLDRIERW